MDRGLPEDRRVYSPADVADRLGVSSSGLRRLALIYERVHGDLPRDPKLGRVWPPEAIDRLEGAREAVRAGRSVSVEQALADQYAGVEPSPPVRRPDPPEPSAALLEELRALREAVEEQNRIMEGVAGRLEAIEEENRALRASLPSADARARSEPEEETPEEETTTTGTPANRGRVAPAASPLGGLGRALRRLWTGWGG